MRVLERGRVRGGADVCALLREPGSLLRCVLPPGLRRLRKAVLADEVEVVQEPLGQSPRHVAQEEKVVGEREDLPLVSAGEGALEEVEADAAGVEDRVGRGGPVWTGDEGGEDRGGEEVEDGTTVRVREAVEEVICRDEKV